MVVFTCYHCGEALQKPKVEKHYNVACRTLKILTCVDCLRDFRGEEYVAHTKCFTEEERYAAKGSIPGGSLIKKGEQKQESWVEMIRSIINKEYNLQPSLRSLLTTISGCSNVPRKKPKFINFVKNSSGGKVNFNDIESAWLVIEKYKNQQSLSQPKKRSIENKEQLHVFKVEEDGEPSFKKKYKSTNENVSERDDQSETKKTVLKNDNHEELPEIFSFKSTILNILNQKGGKASAKKLQKKVLKQYSKETGNPVTEKTIKKYLKKLNKIEHVNVTDNNVEITVQINN